MLDCSKDPTLQPGTWNLWTTGKRRVLFSCPKCAMVALLDHEISDNGMVTPSVDCPDPVCTFHDNIRLIGWVPEERETAD